MTPRQKLINALRYVPFRKSISNYVIGILENKGLVAYGIDEFFGNHYIDENYGRRPILRRQAIEIIETDMIFGKYYSAVLFKVLKKNDIITEESECVITLDKKITSLKPLNA